jgi:hypothetical protein
MVQFSAYLMLVACVLAAPPQVQTPSTGLARDTRHSAASPGAASDPAESSAVANGTDSGAGGGNTQTPTATAGEGPARALLLILNASGVPNHNGQIKWPSIFRLVNADADMQRVEAQLQLAAEQVIAGGVNPKLLHEMRLTVEDMQRLLRADQATRWPSLSRDAYDDAERFLQELKRAPRVTEAAPPARQ